MGECFEFPRKGDKKCKNVIEWWEKIGSHRFPNIAQIARDTIMAMGSSVASESTFSDS